jgi:hypothetical protein
MNNDGYRTYNKLTKDQKRQIVMARIAGETPTVIASRFSISPTLVRYYELHSAKYEPTDEELDRLALTMEPVCILEPRT